MFTEEDDGEFPDGGEVHGFVELAFVDGPVTEEAQDHLVIAAVLNGKGDAGRYAELSTDNGVAAHEVQLGAEQVHGAALALAAAGDLAHQLRHNFVAGHATGESLAVVPVMGHDVVVGAQGVDGSDGDGFLAVVDVKETLDVASGVLPFRLSLKLSNELHLPVKTEQVGFVKFGDVRSQHIPSSVADLRRRPARGGVCAPVYMCRARPSASRAASCTISATLGCAWTAQPSSSVVPSSRWVICSSARSSVTSGPHMWPPSTSP